MAKTWSIKNSERRFSAVTWLIIINVVISLLAFVIFYISETYFDYLALKPANIVDGKSIWTLLTHIFIHGSFFHLFVNMFSLYFIGSLTEKIIGRKRFVWSYILTGLFAGIFTVFLSVIYGSSDIGSKIIGAPEIYMVGASGAIFGILGILTVILPRLKIYLIAGPILVIVVQATLDKLFPAYANTIDLIATFLILIMVFSMFSFSRKSKFALPIEIPLWSVPLFAIVPLTIISLFIQLPIGNVAHLGGFIAGILYGFYLRNKYQRKITQIRKLFR